LLYPNFSREWEAGDWLAAHIPAREKWAFHGNQINETKEQWEKGNTFYHQVLKPSAGVLFEFFRNREIVSAFIGKESGLTKPEIQGIKPESPVKEPYIVFFPGASHPSKQWAARNFAALAASVEKGRKFRIIIAGSGSETALCREIEIAAPEMALSMAGKTSITALLKLIAGAELLLSNDTAALHMGLMCGIDCIALWKGNHYGRFLPYPEDFKNLSICLPDDLSSKSREYMESRFGENYGGEINDIKVEPLIDLLTITLENKCKNALK
jgi:ADP-heptose:LPS heptosyltransferase